MSTHPRTARAITFLTLLALTSCAGCTSLSQYVHNGFKVGPNYCPPGAPVADEWIDSQNPKLSPVSSNYAGWWESLNDPALNRLVQIAYQQNITLREAGYRVAEAQAMRGVVAGDLFPQTQQVIADYTRTQRSTETALFPAIDPSSPFGNLAQTEFSNWRIGGTLAWELDFWGRYRRSIEAADARLESSIANFDDALVLLIAEVAATYVELRTTEQRLAVARENAVLQQESARVAQARLDARAANSELDTPQAKANLGNTLAAVEEFEILRRQTQNRLCVLLGMPPTELIYVLAEPGDIPAAPESIAVGVPAQLIWRRPDVRRAERLLAAQSAEIGVAVSELYPHISIVGTGAWEAGRFSDMFQSSAFGGTIGPSLRWNVLNYGRLTNNIGVQDARFRQLLANFQQTVLQANAEAESAIIAFLRYADQERLLEQSVMDAKEAERVAQIKYREGEIDFNRLFTVQLLLLSQQESLAISRGNSAQAVVALYRSLGGGWQVPPGQGGMIVEEFVPPNAAPNALPGAPNALPNPAPPNQLPANAGPNAPLPNPGPNAIPNGPRPLNELPPPQSVLRPAPFAGPRL